MTEPCFAASISADRLPKSNRSHCSDSAAVPPLTDVSFFELWPRNELLLWPVCQAPMTPADTLGRYALRAIPAASAASRASSQAPRVFGLLDCAMSISSARE